MKLKNWQVLITLFLFVLSCKNVDKSTNDIQSSYYQEKNSSSFNDTYTLQASSSIDFPLDSLTPLTTNSLEIYHDALTKKDYFALLNEYNGDIYIYDCDTKKKFRVIHLYKEGPNGVGAPAYVNFHILSMDSIIICNKWDCRIFLADSNGTIIKKIQLPMPSNGMQMIAGPDPSTENPIVCVNKKIYVSGRLLDLLIKDNTKLKTVISIDLNSGQMKRSFSRPAMFNTASWSGFQYDMYTSFNTSNQHFLYSFSADPYLYECDTNGIVLSRNYVGSTLFKEITPYSQTKLTEKNVDNELPKIEKYDFTSPRFTKIIADPFRKVYYRFTLLPMTDEEYKNSKTRISAESIIICDSSFNKIGEIQLPKHMYNTKMFFVSKNGLYIAKIPELQQSEDNLSFTLLKLIKK